MHKNGKNYFNLDYFESVMSGHDHDVQLNTGGIFDPKLSVHFKAM